jgi:DNA-binding response OmpR family regulator
VSAQPLILTIDRNQRNLELLAQFLSKEGYSTVSVSSLDNFDAILEQSDSVALALVDISGFDRNIWAFCEKLTDKGIPLLVISPQQLAGIRQESLAHGAQGVLFKPLVVKELAAIIRNMLRIV